MGRTKKKQGASSNSLLHLCEARIKAGMTLIEGWKQDYYYDYHMWYLIIISGLFWAVCHEKFLNDPFISLIWLDFDLYLTPENSIVKRDY